MMTMMRKMITGLVLIPTAAPATVAQEEAAAVQAAAAGMKMAATVPVIPAGQAHLQAALPLAVPHPGALLQIVLLQIVPLQGAPLQVMAAGLLHLAVAAATGAVARNTIPKPAAL